MAARFGDMLLEQRRRMGLSIQQVANTIKIRPQIIEFFENGNFASMPPRGYAQGMISSYARFLGLNPREVVNAYFDDLMAYERETSQQGGRFQDAAGYVNSRSSVDNGRFLMVQGGRSTRYGQRPQQAGYVTETGSSEEIRSQRDRFRSTPAPEERALPAARGVARDPRAGYGDGGYSDRGYRGVSSGRPRGGYADADTTQVTPRLRSQSQPYSQRSSAPRSGQRNYQGRGELAPRSGQRNMQRKGSYRGRSDNNRGRMPQGTGRGGSNRGRGGGRAPQNNGLDPRIVYAGIGAVALLLIVLIVVLFAGCLAHPLAAYYGAPSAEYAALPTVQGILHGYQTMDTLAGLNFGAVIALNIRARGVTESRAVEGGTIRAGFIAGGLMLVVYAMLTHIGGISGAAFPGSDTGASVLTALADGLFGRVGQVLLAVIFVIACFNTCVGLIASVGEYFHELLPQLPYPAIAAFFALVSMLLANIGLADILSLSVPVLNAIYPIAIVLIVVEFLPGRFQRTSVWRLSILFTAIQSIPAALPFGPLSALMNTLPLSSLGFGWLLPALIGIGAGLLI
mgnify:CR=1 FL=1